MQESSTGSQSHETSHAPNSTSGSEDHQLRRRCSRRTSRTSMRQDGGERLGEQGLSCRNQGEDTSPPSTPSCPSPAAARRPLAWGLIR